jgi:Na+-transporting methylmalonyl-CoA/oxaloacetate decarboxylase gamma subunit
MAENVTIALQITVIGMGLVFASILLLWGIMALLVRLTADREPAEPVTTGVPADLTDLRAQAAAAAVATALPQSPAPLTIPQPELISPWQSVMRGRQLRQRGNIR